MGKNAKQLTTNVINTQQFFGKMFWQQMLPELLYIWVYMYHWQILITINYGK